MGKAVWNDIKIEGYKNVEGDLSNVMVLAQRVLIKPQNTAGKEIFCQRS